MPGRNYQPCLRSQYYYYFDGRQVGSNGNNGTENNDHIVTLAERVQASPSSPGAFRQGAATGTSYADFDQSYEAISPTSQTATSTTYTIREGERRSAVVPLALPGIITAPALRAHKFA